jgi:hypothetical protein
VEFTFDSNPGAPRTGTLIIGGQNLAVTQAGANYVPVSGVPVTLASFPYYYPPYGVAVDTLGNVFVCTFQNLVQEWSPTNNSLATVVNYNHLKIPEGLAADVAGNVYIADTDNNAVKKWSATDGSLTTLVASGLNGPWGVAVDGAGNVYIADCTNSAVEEWNVSSNTLSTLVSAGLNHPKGVAVDGPGNVYIADTYNNAIKKWIARSNTVITLISTGLKRPIDLAVDGSGNLYISDEGNYSIKKWTAADGSVTMLFSNASYDFRGISVDGLGNVFVVNASQAVMELARAFVDPTSISEGPAGGSDSFPAIVPAAANLLPPFQPVSSQSWLSITGINQGIVGFSFTATASNRSANVTLLGQSVPVSQAGPPVLSPTFLSNGALQFGFSNSPRASFSVITTTNLSLPSSAWTPIGVPTSAVPGYFQFTIPIATNDLQRYYRVSSP